MKIRDASQAAIKNRFSQEAEDSRGQGLRSQKQEQVQKCPEIRSIP